MRSKFILLGCAVLVPAMLAAGDPALNTTGTEGGVTMVRPAGIGPDGGTIAGSGPSFADAVGSWGKVKINASGPSYEGSKIKNNKAQFNGYAQITEFDGSWLSGSMYDKGGSLMGGFDMYTGTSAFASDFLVTDFDAGYDDTKVPSTEGYVYGNGRLRTKFTGTGEIKNSKFQTIGGSGWFDGSGFEGLGKGKADFKAIDPSKVPFSIS